MIDVEKGKYSLKGAVTAGAVLAAGMVAAGWLAQAQGLFTARGDDAQLYRAAQETGTEGRAAPAAYSRILQDGGYVTAYIEPAGEIYTNKELILINPWHLLPENYESELDYVEYGQKMQVNAAEHLREMLQDCRAEGYSPLICSSYRDRYKQTILFENDVRRFMYRGMTEEEAREETARNVAVPGSSEHEAGLAADIVYSGHQVLDDSQELNDTQQWLMEHCHEYGFILRYPRDKQDITGITYEPWHYRYVGEEAAREIMERGICLEEYLGVTDAGSGDTYDKSDDGSEEADEFNDGEE